MLRKINNLYRTSFGRYPYSHKANVVEKKLLQLGIQTTKKQLKRLCRYSETELNNLWYLIDLGRLSSSGARLVQSLKVDPPEIVAPLGDIRELDIEDRVLKEMLIPRRKDLDLDLRGIYPEIEKHLQNRTEEPLEARKGLPSSVVQIDRQVIALMNRITDEAKKFDELANDPDTTIEDIFELIDQNKTNLGFLNVAVYRPLADREGKWILTRRTRYWTEEKGLYDPDKGGHVPVGTLRSVLEGDKLIYDVDLCDLATFERENVEPSEESISDDFIHAKGARLNDGQESRRMLFIRIQSGDKNLFDKYGIEGVILFHNQVAREDPNFKDKYPDPLLPEDVDAAQSVKNILKEYYTRSIIQAIETVRRRTISASQIEKERGGATPVPATPLPASERGTLYDLVMSSRKPLRFGKTLAAARIYNPSTLPEDDQSLILKTLNWKARTKEDMRNHVINVAELEILFYKGQAVAFASGREVDIRNSGSSERMAYLIGTMVKDKFRGRGMQTVANALFLMRRWLRYKFEGGFFKPLRPMMRSRSVPTIAGFLKYFSGVKFAKLEGRDKNRAKVFARSLGCECNSDGVVKNAYKIPVHDSKRDERVLDGVNPKRRKLIHAVLEGLNDKDARIFQGKFGLLTALRLYFYLQVIFRIKNRRLEKALENKAK